MSSPWRSQGVRRVLVHGHPRLTIAHCAGRHGALMMQTLMCTTSASPSSSSASPPSQQGQPASASARATPASPRLNKLSVRVRELLQGSAFQPQASPATRAHALDEVFQLLLAATPRDTASLTPSSSSPDRALHPLLCVRVLDELGCALAAGPEGGGWMRHGDLYPSLTAGASRTPSARPARGPASRATSVRADPQALALLCEAVTAPLLQLIATCAVTTSPSSPPRALPAPVRRVLPVLVEWRCTLPDPTVSLQTWLPLLLPHLEAAYARPSAPHSAHLEAATDGGIPFSVLAPQLVRRLVRSARAGDGGEGPALEAALAEDWLARVLLLARDSRPTEEADAALAQLLFWETDTPLLRHPLVRVALAKALTPVPAVPTVPAVPAVPAVPSSVRLLVPFADDDALRRLLLRLSAAELTDSAEPTHRMHRDVTAFVEPVFVPLQGTLPDETEGTPDLPLRFIRPMNDYVRGLAPSPSPALRLSFAGCISVLGVAIERLQHLRQQSSCNGAHDRRHAPTAPASAAEDNATTAHLTLLPHKPRLHTLKSTCELLLLDARAQLAVMQQEVDRQAGAETASRPLREPLFRDVPAAQQEAVLRRLCGTARALVRVVMEEKRWSVAHEGAEGAALAAGTPSTTGTGTGTGTQALGHVLRNAAHRVMEPALRGYYEATVYEAPPVQVTLTDLDNLLSPPAESAASSASSAPDVVAQPRRRGRSESEWFVERLHDRYGAVHEAMRTVDHVMGQQEVARRTALALLRTQVDLTETIALEAIRLLAIADLIVPASMPPRFPGTTTDMDKRAAAVPLAPQSWPPSEKAAHIEDNAMTTDHVIKEMNLVLNAFFPVWYHAEQQPASQSPGVAHALLLTVLLWMRQCCLRHPTSLCAQPHVVASLRSLEGLLTRQGSVSPWAAVGLEALLPALQNREVRPDDDTETEATEATASRPLAFLCAPLPGSPLRSFDSVSGDLVAAAATTRWAHAEALALLARAAPPGGATWRWLGSTAAVKEAVRELEAAAPAPHTPRYFLLPWSTLAWSRQPLCFYDEGGHSAAAVDAFDRDLQRLLAYCRGAAHEEADAAGGGDAVVAVVRLVPLPEELTLFASASHGTTLAIPGTDMRVVHPEVALEWEILARRRTASSSSLRSGSDDNASDELSDVEYESDEEGDGLD